MKPPMLSFLWLIVMPALAFAASAMPTARTAIKIPDAAHGIGLDDIGYAAALHRITIPAGATGNLVLIDPVTDALTVVHDVSVPSGKAGQDYEGISSSVYAEGYLFVGNHDPAEVVTINPRTRKVIARTALESDPDYVRYVARTHEIWVTETGRHQIQVFRLSPSQAPVLTPGADIHVPDGPEALQIDNRRGRAYTNMWKTNKTAQIDLDTHEILAEWPNTCEGEGSRGITMDKAHNHLFVACKEGKVVTLAPSEHGRVIASQAAGAGVDIVSYSPWLHHLYVPSAQTATLTIFNASGSGMLKPVAIYTTAKGADCVTNDDRGHVFVCDPGAATILKIDDHNNDEAGN